MIAVVGATSWGTTLGVAWARQGSDVILLARTKPEADELNQARQNRHLLPDIAFPERLSATSDVTCLKRADAVVIAVPSQTMRANIRRIAAYLPTGGIVVSASKGIEIDTTLRMSQVIEQEAPHFAGRVAALSGPNLGREIAAGLPAATVVAAPNPPVARRGQELLMTRTLRVYTNRDIAGVELGGALKNVYAMAAGIGDGLGMGDNAKAGLITRGLAEMTRLGIAAGARASTFAGLAGLGDLIATCASPLSRNHQVGILLAKGHPLDEILARLNHIAEGVPTTRAAFGLAKRLNVELPITEMMHRVLFEAMPPNDAAFALLTREAKSEFPDE